MREITCAAITATVRDLCIQANCQLPQRCAQRHLRRLALRSVLRWGNHPSRSGGELHLRRGTEPPSARIPAWQWCSSTWGRSVTSPAVP